MYSVEYSTEALKTLRRLPRNLALRITGKVANLAADPSATNNSVKKLVGRPGYRLRVGDWRVIYDLNDALRVLAVERVAPRGGIYG